MTPKIVCATFPILFSQSFFPFLALSCDRRINTTTLQTWARVGLEEFHTKFAQHYCARGETRFWPPPPRRGSRKSLHNRAAQSTDASKQTTNKQTQRARVSGQSSRTLR